MGLVNFKDIDFNKSIDKNLKTFEFNGVEIGIVPYLSISDKYDLVMITLQKSFENGIYNLVKLNMYFNLHLVYMYTNIQIDNEDREDELKLYDIFMRSGLINKIKEIVPNEEILDLQEKINNMQTIIMKYRNTFGAVLEAFLEELPNKTENIKNIIENIDQDKIKLLKDLVDEFKQEV